MVDRGKARPPYGIRKKSNKGGQTFAGDVPRSPAFRPLKEGATKTKFLFDVKKKNTKKK